MSLSAALNSSVSALNAQSTALAMISSNLANSSTVGYKTVKASFASMLAGESNNGNFSGGGVTVASQSRVTEQGLVENTGISTNVAINGDGFFVVGDGSESQNYGYTRNGSFRVDADGFLTANGNFLMGWPTDATGLVTTSTSNASLEMIDIDKIASIASATTQASLEANLPAEAAINDVFESTMEIYDSLGNSSTVTVSWEKTANNAWTATFSDPVSTVDGSTTGTMAGGTVNITFDGDGNILTPAAPGPSLGVTWNNGASASTIALDLGAPGSSSNLTQRSTGAEDPAVTLEYSRNGSAYGTFEDVTVSDDGLVSAVFSNGEEVPIYRIALATFASADNLNASDAGVYYESTRSGTPTLQFANTGSAGSISGSSVETSTVDTNSEFSRMMQAQQAYSGAAQVMSTVSDMYDNLLSAVR